MAQREVWVDGDSWAGVAAVVACFPGAIIGCRISHRRPPAPTPAPRTVAQVRADLDRASVGYDPREQFADFLPAGFADQHARLGRLHAELARAEAVAALDAAIADEARADAAPRVAAPAAALAA